MNSGRYYQPSAVEVLGSGEPQYLAPEVPAWKGDIWRRQPIRGQIC
jgi:hypothetical protein